MLFLLLTTTLLGAFTALALGLSPMGEALQEKTLDLMFGLRSMTAPPPPTDIVLVGMGDNTFQDDKFRKPFILWHNDIATLIIELQKAGAKVIALDFLLPDVMFDDYIPGYSTVWLRAFLAARMAGTPVIAGYMDLGDSLLIPHKNYLQILGPHNVGYYNLTSDNDGFIRRQFLWLEGKKHTKSSSFSMAVFNAMGEDASRLPREIRINYRPETPHFTLYELAAVMRKIESGQTEFMKTAFAGKVVFIGSMDIRNQDRHPTPLFSVSKRKGKNMPGVLIQAQILASMLDDVRFSELPLLSVLAINLVLSLLVGTAVLWGHRKLTLVWIPLFVGSYTVLCYHAFLNYTILPVVAGNASILCGHVFATVGRDGILNAEQRKLKQVFQRYLPKQVANSLIEQNDADFFKGETRELCILFADIRSFTRYSEVRPPDEIVRRLNEYFEAMAIEIDNNGGIVDKFIGDGILAFFGVLDDTTNPSVNGTRAACGMQRALKRLNSVWQQREEQPFAIGIGLHTGEVMVGNIGSSYKAEFTVIGDAVNLASRLESNTKTVGEPILVSECVAENIRDQYTVTSCGTIAIKGRKAERVYTIHEHGNKGDET